MNTKASPTEKAELSMQPGAFVVDIAAASEAQSSGINWNPTTLQEIKGALDYSIHRVRKSKSTIAWVRKTYGDEWANSIERCVATWRREVAKFAVMLRVHQLDAAWESVAEEDDDNIEPARRARFKLDVRLCRSVNRGGAV